MPKNPLTKEERNWLKKLQMVLRECPSTRLEAYTTGDPYINIFDNTLRDALYTHLESHTCEFGNAAEAVGANLMVIQLPFPLHSTAG